MLSKRIWITVLLTVTFAVTACNESRKKSLPIRQGDPAGKPNKVHEVTYLLSKDDCSTEKQVFTAETKEKATQLMCEGLQDEVRNKSCALEERKEHFANNCEGEWKAQTPPLVDQFPVLDESALEQLRDLEAAEVELDANLEGADVQAAEKILESFKECGFSYTGPNCDGPSFATVLNEKNETVHAGRTEYDRALTDGEYSILTSIDILGDYEVALILDFVFDSNQIPTHVVIYQRTTEPEESIRLIDFIQTEGALRLGSIAIADRIIVEEASPEENSEEAAQEADQEQNQDQEQTEE